LFFVVESRGQTNGKAYQQLQNMAGNPRVALPGAATQGNAVVLKMPPSNLEYVWAIEYSDRLIRQMREIYHQGHPKIKGYLTTQQECMAIIRKMDSGMQQNAKCVQLKNPYFIPAKPQNADLPGQSASLKEAAGIKVEKYDPVEYATKGIHQKEEKQINNDPNVVDLSFLKDPYTSKIDPEMLKDPMENYRLKKVSVPLPEKNVVPETSKHEVIDELNDFAINLVGIITPAEVPINVRVFRYVAITEINLITEDVKAALDCFGRGEVKCPSTENILKNTCKKTAKDIIDLEMDNLGGWASGKLFKSIATNGTKKQMRQMVKKGVLPGIEGVVERNAATISQIGEAHFSVASTGADTGNKILKAFGVQTIFNE
jgi:hypothetical protein